MTSRQQTRAETQMCTTDSQRKDIKVLINFRYWLFPTVRYWTCSDGLSASCDIYCTKTSDVQNTFQVVKREEPFNKGDICNNILSIFIEKSKRKGKIQSEWNKMNVTITMTLNPFLKSQISYRDMTYRDTLSHWPCSLSPPSSSPVSH